jgi:hypothetical protein
MHSPSAHAHPLPNQFTNQLPAPRRNLSRKQFCFAQPLRPERNQRAMRRARHRIFIHARARRKEARDEITIISRRGGDGAKTIKRLERGEIRLQGAHLGFIGKDREIIPRLENFFRRCPQSTKQRFRDASLGAGGRDGKSSVSKSPLRATVSIPLREWKRTSLPGSPRSLNNTEAAANVACPHKSISTVGVNQRNSKSVPRETVKGRSQRDYCSPQYQAELHPATRQPRLQHKRPRGSRQTDSS